MSKSKARVSLQRHRVALTVASGVVVGLLVFVFLYLEGVVDVLGPILTGLVSLSPVVIALLKGVHDFVRGRGTQASKDYPFVACASLKKALAEVPWQEKLDELGFGIPYIARRRQQIDCVLTEADSLVKGVLILGWMQSGKTRELTELLKRNLHGDCTALIYKPDPEKVLGRADYDIPIECSRVLLIVDDLHFRCRRDPPSLTKVSDVARGGHFIDELARLVEQRLEKGAGVEVRLALTSRNLPSDLKAIGWPNHYFWDRFKCVELGHLNAHEFGQVVDLLVQEVPWGLEDEYRDFIEARWMGTFGPLVSAFSKVNSGAGPTGVRLCEEYEKKREEYWKRSLLLAEREKAGARQIFQAIYCLQQVGVLPRWEMVIELATELGERQGRALENVLDELGRYALPIGSHAGLDKIMPVKCKLGYVSSETAREFIHLLKDYGETVDAGLLFDFAHKLAHDHLQPQAAVELWNSLTDSTIADLAYFNMGVALSEQGDIVGAVENYYLSLAENPALATWLLHCPVYISSPKQARVELKKSGSDRSDLGEAYITMCGGLMAPEAAELALQDQRVRELLLELASKAVDLAPESVKANWNRAKVLDSLSIQMEAVRAFEDALQLAPDSAEILAQAAWATYAAADTLADARLEEERETIENRLQAVRRDLEQVREQQRKLEESIDKSEILLNHRRAKVRELEELFHMIIQQSEERERTKIESSRASEQLQSLVTQQGLVKRALDKVAWMLDRSPEGKWSDVDAQKLDEIVRLLDDAPDLADLVSGFLQVDGRRLAVTIARALTERHKQYSDELKRMKEQMAELDERLRELDPEVVGPRLEDAQRRLVEEAERQDLLCEEQASVVAAIQRYERQVLDLRVRQEELDRGQFALGECDKALTWAKRAYEISPSEHIRGLIAQIESDMRGTGHA